MDRQNHKQVCLRDGTAVELSLEQTLSRAHYVLQTEMKKLFAFKKLILWGHKTIRVRQL